MANRLKVFAAPFIVLLALACACAAWWLDRSGRPGSFAVTAICLALVSMLVALIGKLPTRRHAMTTVQLEQARAEIAEALNNMSSGLVMVARDGAIRLYNDRVIDMFHLEPAEIGAGMPLSQYLRNIGRHVGWDAARMQRVIDNHGIWMAKEATTQVEHHFDDGMILAVACRPMPDGGAVLTYDDVTEVRRRAREQARLLRMIDDMPVAVMTVDPATLKINYVNETSKRLIGQIEHLLPIRTDEILGTSIDVFHKHPERQHRLLADPANLPHQARIQLGPEVLDLQVSAINDEEGGYLGPMLTWAIVTNEVEAETRIRQLAHYDTLTGLANRNTFNELLTASLSRGGRDVSLFFIDLDGFKIINDTLGHLTGDKLLRCVADRLRKACDASGMMVGRLGGDEFAILAEGMGTDGAGTFAGALIDRLVAPYQLPPNHRLQIGACVGAAAAPVHGGDADTLLSRADIALYVAKAAGKRTFRVFTPEMEFRVQERVRLERKLRDALQEEAGLFVFYQPIVDIRDERIVAREALIRWHHPKRGWIPPSEFIPVAEDSGLIERLSEFVLGRACRDAAGWDDAARVAVNVSAGQLGRGTLAPSVRAALAGSGLSPDRLEIEVTESAILHEERDCVADLLRVRDMGVRVALDDFGTGFSSLAHLRSFPFDKIKIDGSFVKDAVEREDCAAVVRAIVDLGKRLGVSIVAEGVETVAHLERVVAEGCYEVQGYYFGRPAPTPRDAPIVAAVEAARQTPARTSVEAGSQLRRV